MSAPAGGKILTAGIRIKGIVFLATQLGTDAFVFTPPTDAKKVDVKALREVDEVPAGVLPGGKK
jgi:phage-related protein